MANMIRDVGVVLRTVKLGEADRIVSILTKENGKVKGVAKGARKSGSKYSARLEVGSVVDFQWIPSKRELVRITQTESVASHRNIREDLDLLTAAARMLDAVDALCEDNSAHEELADLTIKALSTMDKEKTAYVCPAFLIRVLSLEGFEPDVSKCPSCSATENLGYFSLEQSAFFCTSCYRESMIKVHPHTRETIRAILEGKTSAVLSNMSDEVANEVNSLAISMIEYHVGISMRAISI